MTLQQLNELLEGEIIGSTDVNISGIGDIENATEGQLTFIRNRKYARYWENSSASIGIAAKNLSLTPKDNQAIIKVDQVDLSMIKILNALAPKPPVFDMDVHPSAVVDKSAIISEGAKIGAGCYIGKNVFIGKETILYPNVTLLDDVMIGHQTTIWSGAVVREQCVIGDACIIHSNASIGADGFGFVPSPDGRGLVKMPHIGNVIIGNGVEIGANSCVDRAKFGSTVLGDGTKIDNLVQIGHNSILGRSCVMAGNSGLAGSVTLGDGVMIGGSASIKDHTTIHSGATVGAGSGVMADVEAGKTVLGYPATDARDMLKQWVALRKLIE
ncbi:UDP-3-O-(3-hydroxymyristoyl)glucosamine N-acyltransferase [Gangjinia marincola]|uniref:UDP-3-O-acylglucosamine N-acyltransferase n=1 Tax=Gangjinia marincola TaxID=578463 RepID=A0ABN1MFV5_9FLAO